MGLRGEQGAKGGYAQSADSGEFWRCTLIESESRLRAARAIAKSETEAAIEAFEQLKGRGHPHSPPAMVSDGWGGYDEAMVEVWGKVPEYRGRGRPPTKKRPGAEWRYLQMVKHRENGRVIGIKAKAIYGDEREVLEELSGGSTSYVERTWSAPTSLRAT